MELMTHAHRRHSLVQLLGEFVVRLPRMVATQYLQQFRQLQ